MRDGLTLSRGRSDPGTGPVGQAGVADRDLVEVLHPGRVLFRRRHESIGLLHEIEAVVALDALEPGDLRLAGLLVERTGEKPDRRRIAVFRALPDLG